MPRGRKPTGLPHKPKKSYVSKSSHALTIRLSNAAFDKLEKAHKKTGYPIRDMIQRRLEYDILTNHGKKRKK